MNPEQHFPEADEGKLIPKKAPKLTRRQLLGDALIFGATPLALGAIGMKLYKKEVADKLEPILAAMEQQLNIPKEKLAQILLKLK